eukprot:CAMPEP_0181315846 /NCGR_PEP_ID=MMETSP1101-20121128/15587_1 /TAXON_ID=46948 /ORGANISM="Rhodomonas abbreviata, Strain Caron Lab Isolate" /LENGTH=439 /DNA_ID=CAMNT_0023423069 /DNA_START=284 /DNA_END=1603 /DNA_ORIENTATION=-
MASLAESQAFLDQFDKCLPLCERGDAVTVINALHTLNTITQASIVQARELDPASDRDFVCSFLIELELALELYISPARKLGTIDGGLPALYSFGEEEISNLVDVPSPSTKTKVRKFLEALGVEPSPEFQERSVAMTVREFLRHQIKASAVKCPPSLPVLLKERENRSISWADQCSSGSDCDSDVPPLAEDDYSDDESSAVEQEENEQALEGFDDSSDFQDEQDEEDEEEAREIEENNSAAAIFLWASPMKVHDSGEYRDEGAGYNQSRRSSGEASDQSYKESAKRQAVRQAEPFFKTRKCKNWEQSGACPFGDRCNFAHGDAELRPADAAILLLATGGGAKPAARRITEGPGGDVGDRWDKRPNHGKSGIGLYKTRMCKNFEASGACVFGDRCMFAHGAAELRKVLVKTRQCNTFTSTGKCPYGSECNYAHGIEDQVRA